MDNNIFPKIWKLIKFGYTIIATMNVQIQTKDCVDSNVFLIRLQQSLWIFPKRRWVWIGNSEYIAVFTILQLLDNPLHVLIKSNKPAWDLSIHSIYLKIFLLVDWNHSMSLMRGAFAVLKIVRDVPFIGFREVVCKTMSWKTDQLF